MKIYLDGFFHQLYQHPDTATLLTNIDEIPNDCDIVAVSFYNNHWQEYQQTIKELSTRTKKLLVNLSEPTPGKIGFTDFVNSINYSNVYLFSDVVFNHTVLPTANIETIISWFICSENLYATQHWAHERIDKLHRGFDRSKRFDCLLGKQRQHRDIINTYYNNSLQRDNIVFSYTGCTQTGIWDPDVDHQRLHWGTLTQIPRDVFLPLTVYNQTYYSIVAETTTENSYNQYTEKVAKPLIAGRPFVAFAGQNYLSNLQRLGFKTFSTVVDESYDSIGDLNQRMKAAWTQVEWLCSQDPAQVYSELEEVLQHNHQHFLTTDWHQAIRKHF
jgi:hypothetical protein